MSHSLTVFYFQGHSELKKRQSAASLTEMPCEYANSAASSQISTSAASAAGSSKVSFYLNDTTNPLKVAGLKATTPDKDAAPGDLQISTAVLTRTTTSPDSQRFKCEAGAAASETSVPAAETSPTATLYNRQSDFNRSKKVFEFLADKQRRQQQEEEEQQQVQQAPAPSTPPPEPEPLESGAADLHTRGRASFKSSQPAPTAATTATSTAPSTDSVVTSSATVTLRRRSELGKCHPLSVLSNKTN